MFPTAKQIDYYLNCLDMNNVYQGHNQWNQPEEIYCVDRRQVDPSERMEAT